MKKILIVFLITLLLISMVGCQTKHNSSVEYTVGFYNLFGEHIDVITKSADFGDVKGVTEGKQTTYTFTCNENSESITEKQLVFYNDILMAEKVKFSNLEKAYLFAKEYRKDFEKNYGKKDTYPNMSSPYSGYLDDISSVEEIKKPCNYYEDYTVEVSEKKTDKPWLHIDKAQKMLGDIKYSRIDLRLELQVLSDDLAYVSVKYMILR